MESKIRVKIGEIEVECEGSEEFIATEVPKLLTTMLDVQAKLGQKPPPPPPGGAPHLPARTGGGLQGTTSTIAAKLKCTSGTDLAICAAARLRMVMGKSAFTRAEILAEMKSATAYYRKSYANNLSTTLSRLVASEQLAEQSKGTYALGAKEMARLEKEIG